ncbi:MAG TPA: hypothetical protein VGL77_17355 [Armatimonadota bacterium]
MLLVLVGVVVMVVTGGCRKWTSSFQPETPPAPSVQQPAQPPVVDAAQEAVSTVTDYLTALQDGKYSTAYALLSRSSQRKHTMARFEQQGKQGMPSFDLKSAKATITEQTAMVDVRQLDDPATHGFHLIREDGAWKIVYQGGLPGMPYAE